MTVPSESLTLPVYSDRLRLRRMRESDVEDVYAYQKLPEVAQFLFREPWTLERTRQMVVKNAGRRFSDEGDHFVFAVERRDLPGVIGEVVLMWANKEARQAELGYIFNPAFGGAGYATEATRAAVAYGFQSFNFHRIFARLDAANRASMNICRRLGMRQEAHLVENDWLDGQWSDEYVFALLQREWANSAQHSPAVLVADGAGELQQRRTA